MGVELTEMTSCLRGELLGRGLALEDDGVEGLAICLGKSLFAIDPYTRKSIPRIWETSSRAFVIIDHLVERT